MRRQLLVAIASFGLPLGASAQSPDMVARALVQGIPDPTYSSSAVVNRMNQTPQDKLQAVVADWKEALATATGESFDDPMKQMRLAMMPARMSELYVPDGFQVAKATEYGARIRQFSPDRVKQWATAVGLVSGGTPDRGLLLLEIIRLPGLFVGGKLDDLIASAYLAKLGSLSKQAVSAWSAAQGSGNMDEASAALKLSAVERLFVKNQFQTEVFQAALPVATRLLAEAKAKPR